MPGTSMRTSYMRWRHFARRSAVSADFRSVQAWLAAFQARTAHGFAPLEMDAGVSARLATRFADDPSIDEDLARLGESHDRLRVNRVPRTAVHGDLWHANVL